MGWVVCIRAEAITAQEVQHGSVCGTALISQSCCEPIFSCFEYLDATISAHPSLRNTIHELLISVRNNVILTAENIKKLDESVPELSCKK